MGMMVPCKLWQGHKDDRYGRRTISGKQFGAHRLAWEEAYGPIPAGLHVLHFCDVRNCVCSQHLFLGTNADNTADKVAKGRQARGEKLAGDKNWRYGKGYLQAGEKGPNHTLTWEESACTRYT